MINKIKSLILVIIWVVPHLIGWWEYNLISVLFPLLWLITESHNLDIEQRDSKQDVKRGKNKK